MMRAMASRADWEGPKGFSLESIMTASGACGLRREAAASMGSVAKRKVAAADAAADRCRKERREKSGMRILVWEFEAEVEECQNADGKYARGDRDGSHGKSTSSL